MTITREQVEAMAVVALGDGSGWGPDTPDEIASLLRALWQRVEEVEARIAELEAARPEILR